MSRFNYKNSKNGNQEFFEQPEQPRQIKLEVETRLEAIVMKLIIATVIVIPAFIIFCFLEGVSFLYIILMFFVDVLAGILLIATRFLLDEYYILDYDKKAILLKSKIFSKEKISVITPFSGISAVVANGKWRKRRERQPLWYYRTEIITTAGKHIPISNWEIDGFGRANSTAIQISKNSGALYVNSKLKTTYMPTSQRGKFTFIEKKTSKIEVILTLAFDLAVLVFMLYLIKHFPQ